MSDLDLEREQPSTRPGQRFALLDRITTASNSRRGGTFTLPEVAPAPTLPSRLVSSIKSHPRSWSLAAVATASILGLAGSFAYEDISNSNCSDNNEELRRQNQTNHEAIESQFEKLKEYFEKLEDALGYIEDLQDIISSLNDTGSQSCTLAPSASSQLNDIASYEATATSIVASSMTQGERRGIHLQVTPTPSATSVKTQKESIVDDWLQFVGTQAPEGTSLQEWTADLVSQASKASESGATAI